MSQPPSKLFTCIVPRELKKNTIDTNRPWFPDALSVYSIGETFNRNSSKVFLVAAAYSERLFSLQDDQYRSTAPLKRDEIELYAPRGHPVTNARAFSEFHEKYCTEDETHAHA